MSRTRSGRVLAAVAALLCLTICAAMAGDFPKVVINGEAGAVAELGSIVNVCGTTNAQMVSQTCLLVDRRSVDAKSGSGAYSLNWDTSTAGFGGHSIEIIVISGNGAKRTVSRVQVNVTQGAPVTISVPSGAIGLGKPQTLTVTSASGYSPVRARLYVDSTASRREPAVKNGGIEWDANAVPAGDHTLRAVTWDANGYVAYSRPISVRVPDRLVVHAPESATVTDENPDIAIEVVIPEGVEVRKLKGFVDGEVALELDSRCDSLKLPALELESGSHEVSVELLDGSGATCKWGPRPVTVENKHRADLAAKAVAETAAAEAAEKKQQELMEQGAAEVKAQDAAEAAEAKEKERRKKINDWVSSASYRDAARQSAIDKANARAKLANSGGTIGRACGMCVVTVGDIVEFGELCSITAKITPDKAATLRVNASEVDEYFVDSITKARKYLIGYVKKAGYKVDWMKSHIDLHYQSGGPMGGDSAGAAMATAMLSAALQIPVRNEVVITGAIEPDGTILPVGGVDLKAAAAFKDPKILTIIIPRFIDNVVDVLSLPPSLLVGHRLIAARNMEEVLRQALVGYDQGTLAQASQLFSQGLALYGAGKNDEAIACLEAAMKLTPEDLTIPVWIGAIKGPKK
jgi:hypothetical protein